jgi:hypothetical protein
LIAQMRRDSQQASVVPVGSSLAIGREDQDGQLGLAVGADRRIAALAHQVTLERLTTRARLTATAVVTSIVVD